MGLPLCPRYSKNHLNYFTNILHVNSYTSDAAIHCELGRMPLQFVRKPCFKNWMKLLSSKNCILKSCYGDMYYAIQCKNKCKNWAVDTELMGLSMFTKARSYF